MDIVIDNDFANLKNDSKSVVFQIYPDIYGDRRGYFCQKYVESLNYAKFGLDWFTNFNWVRQINESHSQAFTIRGCHAQKGEFCQGKLVESLHGTIYDIITDARPDSNTFGMTKAYILDPIKKNMLWVPRGFLHAFCTSTVDDEYAFQYFCDNIYCKNSEIGVNPLTLIPSAITDGDEFNDFKNVLLNKEKLLLSDKDMNNMSFDEFKKTICRDGKAWYK